MNSGGTRHLHHSRNKLPRDIRLLGINCKLRRGRRRRRRWEGHVSGISAVTTRTEGRGRGGKKKETIESSPDVSPLRIFGLRRADEARARSPEYRCCSNSSDHWSLSQEGTQKEKNRLPPVKKNRGTCWPPWSRDRLKRADSE